jgi:hypothetical protein|tara:strand:- start:424 stop:588 length:165 start_codon:yes stop_codon:yes gene_type:complete
MGPNQSKTVKIDWDKIADTHPYFREVVAKEEGVVIRNIKQEESEEESNQGDLFG